MSEEVSRSDIVALVNAAISDVLSEDASGLSRTKAVTEIMDVDSLGMIELFMAIEEQVTDKFGRQISIEEHEMEAIKSLSDLDALVAEKIVAADAAPAA